MLKGIVFFKNISSNINVFIKFNKFFDIKLGVRK